MNKIEKNIVASLSLPLTLDYLIVEGFFIGFSTAI